MTQEYASTTDLAARWGVSKQIARNHTRSPGFPDPLQLGDRSHRFLLTEVAEWEQQKRRATRRIHAGTWPQHHRPNLPPPAWVRTRLVEVPA